MDIQTAEQQNPQDYYMSRVDDETQDTVWDVEARIETGYPAGTAVMTRRCKWVTAPATPPNPPDDPFGTPEVFSNGYQQIQGSPDSVSVKAAELEFQMDFIFQTWVHAEIWNDTFQYWERPLPVVKRSEILYEPIFDGDGNVIGSTNRIKGIEYTAEYGNGNFLKTVVDYNWFLGNPSKFTYRLYWPGALKRIYTQTQVYNTQRFVLDLSDFTGEIDVSGNAALIDIVYYPSGVLEDTCEVDPYLGVDEQGSFTDVFADGYVLRLANGANTDVECLLRDPTNTVNWGRVQGCELLSGGTNYRLRNDTSKVLTVNINTPTYVKITIKGDYLDFGDNPLPGESGSSHVFHIFPDRVFMESTLNPTGTINLDVSEFQSNIVQIIENITNGECYYELNDTEVLETGFGRRNTSDYLLLRSNEIDVMTLLKEDIKVGSAVYGATTGNWLAISFYWEAGTITAPSTQYAMVLIDSASRVGGKQYNTLADRLDIRDQYKNLNISPTPDIGAWVTDQVIPLSIPVGSEAGFDSGGAFRADQDGATDKIQITYDRRRIKTNLVSARPLFQSGPIDNPTDHVLNHLPMDDNAANNTLTALKGPDASWLAFSNGAPRNTNLDSVVEIGRGRNLYTRDGIAYAELISGSGTVHNRDFFKKGSILITFKNLFNYNDPTDQRIFIIYVNGSNRIYLQYESDTDNFEMEVRWGGNTVAILGTAFTENFSLQREMTALCWWDSDKDLFGFSLNNEIKIGVNSSVPTDSNPNTFRIGVTDDTRVKEADIIIDDIITFNEAILPYGATFTGNGGLLADINTPHENNTFLWDCQDDPAKAGVNLATDKTGVRTGSSVYVAGGLRGNYYDNVSNQNSIRFSQTVNGEIIDPLEFTIIIAARYPAIVSGDVLFGFGADGSNLVQFYHSSATNVRVRFRDGGTERNQNYGNVIVPNVWNFIRLSVKKSTNYLKLFLNGIDLGGSQTFGTWTGTVSDIYFGAGWSGAANLDCHIGYVHITDNAFTPEIWTAFGKPLHLPLLDLA